MKRKLLALLLAGLLALGCLTACGASSTAYAGYEDQKMEVNNTAAAPESMEMPAEEPAAPEEIWIEEESPEMPEAEFSSSVTQNTDALEEQTPDFAEKIIYSGNVTMETNRFDQAIAALEQTVQDMGGFIQDSNVEGYSRTNDDGTTSVVNRWAHYTVRVPANQFDAFMNKAGDIGSVVNSGRSAENVTSQYTNYQARLDSLTIQEERLLDMLKKSGDLKDLITLEDHLAEVRYEIDSITRNLKNLDQRLSYSTVSLGIQEVEVYTPRVTVTRTFGEKVSDAFSDGWKSFVRGIQNLTIAVVNALPTLILLVIAAAAVIFLVRSVTRKRKAKKQKKLEDEETE